MDAKQIQAEINHSYRAALAALKTGFNAAAGGRQLNDHGNAQVLDDQIGLAIAHLQEIGPRLKELHDPAGEAVRKRGAKETPTHKYTPPSSSSSPHAPAKT